MSKIRRISEYGKCNFPDRSILQMNIYFRNLNLHNTRYHKYNYDPINMLTYLYLYCS